MHDTETALASILSHCVSLRQRIKAFKAGAKFQSSPEGAARLERWVTLYQQLGSSAFTKRLDALGLSRAELPLILGNGAASLDETDTPWIKALGEILRALATDRDCEVTKGSPKSRSPFVRDTSIRELYLPVVSCARQLLKSKTAHLTYPVGSEVYAALENFLLDRLANAGRQVVQVRYATFRSMSQLGLEGSPPPNQNDDKSWFYAFVHAVPGHRLLEIFKHYPAHARHCAMLVLQWVETTDIFLTRLSNDYIELCDRFAEGNPLGDVHVIQPGLSDPHDGGQTVISVEFTTGIKIVYKPRSLRADRMFYEFLDALGNVHSFRHFHWPQLWDRDGYGWMGFVLAATCPDRASVKRFYWRAGALLGLVQLARGVDCHRENLIACGEHPCLIDLETLWHPERSPNLAGGKQNRLSDGDTAESVLRTGFLPAVSNSGVNRYVSSALVGNNMQSRVGHHQPAVGSDPVSAGDHIPIIQAGFRWTGRRILADAALRTHFDGWLHEIAVIPRRRVLRSTATYIAVLNAACNPNNLKNQVDFELAQEFLYLYQHDISLTDREVRATSCFNVPRINWSENDTPIPRRLSPSSLDSYLKQLPIIRSSLEAMPIPFTTEACR